MLCGFLLYVNFGTLYGYIVFCGRTRVYPLYHSIRTTGLWPGETLRCLQCPKQNVMAARRQCIMYINVRYKYSNSYNVINCYKM